MPSIRFSFLQTLATKMKKKALAIKMKKNQVLKKRLNHAILFLRPSGMRRLLEIIILVELANMLSYLSI